MTNGRILFMKYLPVEQINKTGIATALYTLKTDETWRYACEEDLPNYAAIANVFGAEASDMVRIFPSHSSSVKVITAADKGEGVLYPAKGATPAMAAPIDPDNYDAYDAMITNIPGVVLCGIAGDCPPVYLLDAKTPAIAMIHSGWRGTAGQISANALRLMTENYGTDPADVIAHIGPHICRDCYEVSADLIPEFAAHYSEDEMAEIFTARDEAASGSGAPVSGAPTLGVSTRDASTTPASGKYLLDLSAAIAYSLIHAGVPAEQISDCGHCSFHDERFCSWRRDGLKHSRTFTAIALKP